MYANYLQHLHFFVPWPAEIARQEKSVSPFLTTPSFYELNYKINPTHLTSNEKNNITWLVVEPTHLKNMLVKTDHFPNFRGENKTYFKTPPSYIPREN